MLAPNLTKHTLLYVVFQSNTSKVRLWVHIVTLLLIHLYIAVTSPLKKITALAWVALPVP
jgi:hypothetical protein